MHENYWKTRSLLEQVKELIQNDSHNLTRDDHDSVYYRVNELERLIETMYRSRT